MSASRPRRRAPLVLALCVIGASVPAGLGAALVALITAGLGSGNRCGSPAPGGQVVLGPPGTGQLVGATEYGGPGDPSSGTVGASGQSLLAHPDSYAELGGLSFQTATAMGGLPYMTPLEITWRGRSAIAYKRDFGLGGGPVDGFPRAIDLWWELAGALGVPYENGLWSGPLRVERPPPAGAGSLLADTSGVAAAGLTPAPAGAADPAACDPVSADGLPVSTGPRAELLRDGQAAAPADAPTTIKRIIAAGNQIVGKPYLYGGGHGVALSALAPAYDCSSSVEHLLWGGGLLPAAYDAPSGTLESFGAPGPGRWVTLYASAEHVFMYVAGLRWDTHDAAGPGDGSSGIGWHPEIRSAAGFVARHPVGL